MVENKGGTGCPADCRLHLKTLGNEIMDIKHRLSLYDKSLSDRIKWVTFAWIALLMVGATTTLMGAVWHEVTDHNDLMNKLNTSMATIAEKTDNIEDRISSIIIRAEKERNKREDKGTP